MKDFIIYLVGVMMIYCVCGAIFKAFDKYMPGYFERGQVQVEEPY